MSQNRERVHNWSRQGGKSEQGSKSTLVVFSFINRDDDHHHSCSLILALSRTSGATHSRFRAFPRRGLTVLSAVRGGEYQNICQRTSFVHLFPRTSRPLGVNTRRFGHALASQKIEPQKSHDTGTSESDKASESSNAVLNHHLSLWKLNSPLTRCELSRIGHSHMCICLLCRKLSFLFFPSWQGLTMRMNNMAHCVTFWSRQRLGPERHWHI